MCDVTEAGFKDKNNMYANIDTSGSDTIAVTRQIRVANRRHPLPRSQAMWEKEMWFGNKTSTTCTVCVKDCEGRQLPGVVAQ